MKIQPYHSEYDTYYYDKDIILKVTNLDVISHELLKITRYQTVASILKHPVIDKINSFLESLKKNNMLKKIPKIEVTDDNSIWFKYMENDHDFAWQEETYFPKVNIHNILNYICIGGISI